MKIFQEFQCTIIQCMALLRSRPQLNRLLQDLTEFHQPNNIDDVFTGLDDIGEINLPIVDKCLFENMQSPPIHSKLDRAFINVSWDEILPDSSLLSLPRMTSDHFPLIIEISTNIPNPKVFRYYNGWKYKASFKDLVSAFWPSTPVHVDAADSLVSKLKTLREKAKSWKKSLQPD
jgi:hypothetical protein